jgi:hypothetical protein
MLLGRITFNGSDGTAFQGGAFISAAADGQTWVSGDCPTRLVFATTADNAAAATERLRITSGGSVLVGTSTFADNNALLHVSKDTSGSTGGSIVIRNGAANASGNMAELVFKTSLGFSNGFNSAKIAAIQTTSAETADLAFYTYGAGLGTERARIDSSGRLLVGTSTANTSGAKLQTSDGLTFPATAVASADPNTLDDYEEGTWTPVFTDGTNNATMNASTVGKYTKIGNTVHAQCDARCSALNSMAGDVRISGLPFNGVTAYVTAGVIGGASNLSITAGQSLSTYIPGAASYMWISLFDLSTGSSILQASELGATGRLFVNISYQVS